MQYRCQEQGCSLNALNKHRLRSLAHLSARSEQDLLSSFTVEALTFPETQFLGARILIPDWAAQVIIVRDAWMQEAWPSERQGGRSLVNERCYNWMFYGLDSENKIRRKSTICVYHIYKVGSIREAGQSTTSHE